MAYVSKSPFLRKWGALGTPRDTLEYSQITDGNQKT